MAVADDGVASNVQHLDTNDLERPSDNHVSSKDQDFNLKTQSLQNQNNINDADVYKPSSPQENTEKNDGVSENGGDLQSLVLTKSATMNETSDHDKQSNLTNAKGDSFNKDLRDLEEMLSKLNPMAQEFVPPSLTKNGSVWGIANINNFGYASNFLIQPNAVVNANGFTGRRRRNSFGSGKKRLNSRTSMAQQEEVIRRTAYVSDIDHQVTEEQLAALFINCGQVVDCRVCGDPNSILRFAFVEFTDEEGACNALSLSGTMLGYYPVRVLPSKTAIAPVNPTFLPKSEDEREMCARTVYCTNIDKKVTQADIKLFFETCCGQVHRLRLLGDYHHSTRIAFVEFVMAESAIAALNCSGAVLSSLPIRVSPSKTPVRPRTLHSPLH